MKITDVQLGRYARRDESGAPAGGEIQIVEVQTDTGMTGRGFLTAGNVRQSPTADLCATIVRRNLRNAVLGEDPLLNERVWRRMAESFGRRGTRGFVMGCIAAIDFALWDIKGKAAGLSVAALLGDQKQRVATYANAAHGLPPAELAAKCSEYVAAGHRALKIRGSFVSLKEATARLAAVREAVGPDVKIMVDVNGTWDADTAIQQLKAWERYDVYWLEEPVSPEDVAGYVAVRKRAGRVNIAGGEQHSGVLEFRALLDAGAVDFLQPNAGSGGITDWLRAYSLATSHGVPVSPWDLQAVHLQLAASLANVKWIEYFMPDNPLLEFQNRLFREPRFEEERLDDGVYLLPPTKPGLGIELDEAEAERCLLPE